MSRQSANEGGGGIAAFGNGLVGRVVDRAMANPAASGGLLVMALTAGAIAFNATFLQGANHLRPNLAPRPAATAPAAVPTPRTREAVADVPPAPTISPAVTGVAPPPAPTAAAVAALNPTAKTTPAPVTPAIVTAIQQELVGLSLYAGPVDGIAGSLTKAAISAYQTAARLPVTGAPSAELLATLKAPMAATRAPVQAVPVAKPVAAPAPAAPTQAKPTTATAAKPAAPTPVPPATVPAPSADTYRKVQLALNQIGYGPIPVDGKAGTATAEAIRHFQLDSGLTLTGVPDDAVTKRLATIGAIASR